MKTKYAVILTVISVELLVVAEVFLSHTFHIYGIILGCVLGWQIKKIYMYFKNGG